MDRGQQTHNVNASPFWVKLANRMEAVPGPLARTVGCRQFVFARPQRAASGPKGQPFPQLGSQALEVGRSHTIPSGPTGRPFHEPRGRRGEWLARWADQRGGVGAIHGPMGVFRP